MSDELARSGRHCRRRLHPQDTTAEGNVTAGKVPLTGQAAERVRGREWVCRQVVNAPVVNQREPQRAAAGNAVTVTT